MEEAKLMTMTRRRRRSYFVPDEIQRKIMLKLPGKSLIRFRSVDKRLKSLISAKQFITDHLETFRCEEDALILLHRERSSHFSCCIFLDGVVPKHVDDIRLPYEIASYSVVRTVGYCNGVACMIRHRNGRSTCDVLFLNPSIRKVVAIPGPDHLSGDTSSLSLSFGFGYVEDDYKLVVLPCTSASGAPLTAKVFSLKTRNWATMTCSWPQPQHPHHRHWKIASEHPVFVDGACHWLAKDFDVIGRSTNFVLSFYLGGDHTIGKIVLPSNLSNCANVSIYVYDGHLSLMVGNHDLWVMNKCGAVTSWTRLIQGMQLVGSETSVAETIVGFSGGGGVVYGRQYLRQGWIDEELLRYHPTTKTNLPLKNNHKHGLLYPDRLYAYSQNLILLDQDDNSLEN